jgi:flagellar motor component MotA
MDLSILMGLIIFLAIVAGGLVYFIGSALDIEDARKVDRTPSKDYHHELK